MPDLSTTYMGLSLKNPIIAASSGITKSVEKIADCEKAGAGAVVIKSVFEEVLAAQDYGIGESATFHTEAYDYMRSELELQYGPKEYCDLIQEAKAKVDIPVIASINCISSKWWTSYAKQFQDAGADALELNVFKTASRLDETSQSIEDMYYDIIESVKKQVSIPVALKIGVYFTALPNVVASLARKGANGIVLFNRFTEPDINIDKLTLNTTFSLSSIVAARPAHDRRQLAALYTISTRLSSRFDRSQAMEYNRSVCVKSLSRSRLRATNRREELSTTYAI